MNVRILLVLWFSSAHDLFNHGILSSHTVRSSANDATLDDFLGGVLHAFRGKTSTHNHLAYLRFLAVFAARLKLAAVGAPAEPGFLIFSPLPAAILRRLAWMLA